jgi:hypothetical protein
MKLTAGIAIHGKPHTPTWVHPDRAHTTNTVPLSVIADTMSRAQLTVDVDVLAEGRRTARDSYGRLYESFLRGQPVAGQRTTLLLVSLDTRRNAHGLSWRTDPTHAVIAAARRIAIALNQTGCRAVLMSEVELADALSPGEDSYREHWRRVRRAGRSYITSYALTDPAELGRVWAYPAEHTAIRVAMRHSTTGVTVAGLVSHTTTQPVTEPIAGLRPLTGRQWHAIDRPERILARCPAFALTEEMDEAIVAGGSGVLIGKTRDVLMLLPLTDPVTPANLSVHADERDLRQLFRRAHGALQRIDPGSLSINNGRHGDIRIDHHGDAITVTTPRFSARLAPAEFGAEEPWL